VSTLFGAGCLSYIWITVNVILVKALEGTEYKGQIIVVCFGLLFTYPTTYYLRKKKIDKILLN